MVGLNFSKTNLNKSALRASSVSGFISGDEILIGIWEGKTLVEVFTSKLSQSNSLRSAIGLDNIRDCNIVHADQIFEHVDYDSFEPNKIKQYFGDSASKLDESNVVYEKLKQQKVFTLSVHSKQLELSLTEAGLKSKIHHLSTALANLALDRKDQVLILIAEGKLHLVFHKNGKFQSFTQEEVSTANDYLYFILLSAKRHNFSISDFAVSIGGEIDKSAPVYSVLKSYIPQLEFFNSQKYKLEGNSKPYHYYLPLILARVCA